ncbi:MULTISPECIES: glycosyltransferase [Bradyrhizobium]|uniref:Glycosyltransferase involved in cell wall bisynthesis n=1 Tax=Bradyrhizobium yuanmingense TaxID=108015 RepID=A0A1C3UQB3_9BRAD|nr:MULTISPECIES: glycosyltransferase [Bradyrhizobium]MCA1430215.1 glycosyltransferase [Bradyrhizobium sp. NBAIM16]MCA1507949.1 glycosyltransferase [Bradyrhizobium sp. NBAIM02]TWI32126.1 glycosyltransferase involved in cell wall biosynthesis [Bradyrhizobium yuanmingense]SCB17648.1 Glycosyltransferase involved in cell wall bisynthesis [Bradyrhizobium yuanmingense]
MGLEGQGRAAQLERFPVPCAGYSGTEINRSPRRAAILEHADRFASERADWREKAAFFHREDERYLRFLIPPGSRVLEIGCGIGDTLGSLRPSYGIGIDFSAAQLCIARQRHPDLIFIEADVEDPSSLAKVEGPFDFILVLDTIGSLDDCQGFLDRLHAICSRETRLVIGYFSHLWYPALRAAEAIGLRMPQPEQNVLSPADLRHLSWLADFDPVKSEQRLLSPVSVFGLGRFVNRFLSVLPGVRALSLRHYLVARSLRCKGEGVTSVTIVIPARNERGNIEPAVQRISQFCEDIEIIFIEGHSKDGTFEEMERVKQAFPRKDIKAVRQPGKGKADAVFSAFEIARGDVLMILDADLTMPPEQLGKFYETIRSGKAEFVNGSRLVYPMDEGAMRFLNLIANKVFSYLFSWLLNQRYTDTLCGTKVLRRSDFRRLKAGRTYFGDFDPFGDFDLIFGASKLNLKSADLPIRYVARSYGETQISRFRHGWMLLQMVAFAFFKIKAI